MVFDGTVDASLRTSSKGLGKLDFRDSCLRSTIREQRDMHILHVSRSLVERVSGSEVVPLGGTKDGMPFAAEGFWATRVGSLPRMGLAKSIEGLSN